MKTYMNFQNYKKIVFILTPLLLSGCLLERDPYIDRKWSAKVQVDSRSHLIKFKSGKTGLSRSDRDTLKRLHREFDHLDKVMVRIGVEHAPALGKSPKTRARVDGIRRYLGSLGISQKQMVLVDKNELKGSDIPGGNGIVVSFQIASLVMPNCPGWNYRMDGNVPPEGEPDFGCATARNTAMMVSDPYVLEQGEEFGGSDGARSALSVQDLRTDKVKKLKVEQLKSSSGSQN